MKKFNPFKNKKKIEKEDTIGDDTQDDSALSPWQKENLKFLKNNDDVSDDKEEIYAETKIDSLDHDVFEQNQSPSKKSKIRRYMKPTDFEEEDDKDWLKVLPFNEENQTTNENDDSQTEHNPSSHQDVDRTKQLLALEKELLGEEEDDEEDIETEPIEPPKRKPHFSKKVKIQAGIIGSVLGIALLLSLYYASPLSRLNQVVVTGNQLIPSDDIIKTSSLQSGQNIWKQFKKRQQDIKKIKKAYPGLKTVTMTLSGVNNIKINVQEYSLSGYLIVDKIKYSPILSNGTIISKKKLKKKPSGVLYANFKQGEFLSKVIASYEQVPDNIRTLIQQITLTPSDGNSQLVTLYMKDGNQVKVSGTEIGQKMKYYDQVTSQMSDKGIVDMEVGIYSYPYGNENTERRKSTSVADGTVITTPTEDSKEDASQEMVIPEN